MLDLTQIMTRIGELFTKELAQNLSKQREIGGGAFSPIKPSTAWGRVYQNQRRRVDKNLAKGLTFKEAKAKAAGRTARADKTVDRSTTYPPGISKNRLYYTKDLFKRAFRFRVNPKSVTVYVSNDQHRTPGTDAPAPISDIIAWNNASSPEVNGNIAHPPLIWPMTREEIAKMRAVKLAEQLLHDPKTEEEIAKQMKGSLSQTIKTVTRV